MELRKLENYEEHECGYSHKTLKAFDALSETLDTVALEAVRNLAEMTYKEGLRDGLRLMDWLCDR